MDGSIYHSNHIQDHQQFVLTEAKLTFYTGKTSNKTWKNNTWKTYLNSL